MLTEEKHTPTRSKKARKSEQDKDRQQWKSTYKLETRR
jgi:hypothetical protein